LDFLLIYHFGLESESQVPKLRVFEIDKLKRRYLKKIKFFSALAVVQLHRVPLCILMAYFYIHFGEIYYKKLLKKIIFEKLNI